jgi:hypothetical protein
MSCLKPVKLYRESNVRKIIGNFTANAYDMIASLSVFQSLAITDSSVETVEPSLLQKQLFLTRIITFVNQADEELEAREKEKNK